VTAEIGSLVSCLDAMLASMIRLGTVVLGADEVERAVSFWSGVLGYDTEGNRFCVVDASHG